MNNLIIGMAFLVFICIVSPCLYFAGKRCWYKEKVLGSTIKKCESTKDYEDYIFGENNDRI